MDYFVEYDDVDYGVYFGQLGDYFGGEFVYVVDVDGLDEQYCIVFVCCDGVLFDIGYFGYVFVE